jgi:hypothetical protein
MRPIPHKLRRELGLDPFMKICVHCSNEPVEWNHVWTYAGKQINEIWSIIPLCQHCHRGNSGTIFQEAKERCEYESIKRLVDSGFENLEFYQKLNDKTWENRINYYTNVYENDLHRTTPEYESSL